LLLEQIDSGVKNLELQSSGSVAQSDHSSDAAPKPAIDLAAELSWSENARNYSSRTPGSHLDPIRSARANQYLQALWVEDAAMVESLPGLRRKAGLR
jgi:hypothetical protein